MGPGSTGAQNQPSSQVRCHCSVGRIVANPPPRKRAKTEDEKEQRRVERVLRNRRAAQSSRERKRQEVEALEKRNKDLEDQLLLQKKQNEMLMDELNRFKNGSSPIPHPSPLTLSQPLFGGASDEDSQVGVMGELNYMPNNGTVDPSSISPALSPVADDAEPASPVPEAAVETSTAVCTSTDVTQHPAAMLCDPQCPSVLVPQTWTTSRQMLPPALALYLQLSLLLAASSTMLSTCRRPLTLIAGALKHNLALRPTPSILSTIIWMITLPPGFRTSTFHNSLVTMSAALKAQRPATTRASKTPNPLSSSPTLRIKSLQKLLTSSPILARPLLDATMELLRLVTEGHDDRVEGLADGSPGIKGDRGRGPLLWPDGASLPSREVLLTLMWAIRVEERNMKARREAKISPQPAPTRRPVSNVPQDNKSTNQNYILSVASKKRKRDTNTTSNKRLRPGY